MERNIYTDLKDLNLLLAYTTTENLLKDRGMIYLKLGEKEKAMDDFIAAIDVNPRFSEAYNARGNLHKQKKNYPKAISDFSQAVEYNPKYYKAFNNRGIVFKAIKDYAKAIKDFRRAISLNKEYVLGYMNLGNSLRDSGDLEGAIREGYTKAIEVNTEHYIAFLSRARVYTDLEEYDKAFVDFNKAQKLKPGDPYVYLYRGYAYFIIEDYQNAEKDYKKVLEINPKDEEAKYSLKQTQDILSSYYEVISFE